MNSYGKFTFGLFVLWWCAAEMWDYAGMSNSVNHPTNWAFVTLGLIPMIVLFRFRMSDYYEKHEEFVFRRKDILPSIVVLIYLGVLLYVSDINLSKLWVIGAAIVGIFLVSLRITNWNE